MTLELWRADEGSGQPAVLLHGLGLDHQQWDGLVPLLGGRRLVRPDLRGHGRSPAPSHGYHAAHYAADVGALLASLGPTHADLIGSGLGAAVALEVALDRPDRVRSLVLLGPSIDGFGDWSEGWMGMMRKLAKAAYEESVVGALNGVYLADAIFDGVRDKPPLLARAQEMFSRFSGLPLRGDARGERPAGPPALERLGDLCIPVLAVCGADDRGDFHEQSRLVEERAPLGKREVLDGGHFVEQENPEALAPLVNRFWSALDHAAPVA